MSEEDITQISFGGLKVGIRGLKEAIEQARRLSGRPDQEIGEALLEALQGKNYLPAGAREQYRQAFLKEFKKALGEVVADEEGGLRLKVLGPGCASCQALVQLVIDVLAEMGLPGAVEHVTDVKEITRLGFISLPVLIINDEVKAVAASPSRTQLKHWLLEAQKDQGN